MNWKGTSDSLITDSSIVGASTWEQECDCSSEISDDDSDEESAWSPFCIEDDKVGPICLDHVSSEDNESAEAVIKLAERPADKEDGALVS